MKIKKDSYYYDFYKDDRKIKEKMGRCEICNRPLNYGYYKIIKKLEKNDLLPDDFIKKCCVCGFILEYSEMITITYHKEPLSSVSFGEHTHSYYTKYMEKLVSYLKKNTVYNGSKNEYHFPEKNIRVLTDYE